MRAKRIISLLPSATEIVGALGAADRLVGRSHECDYPPEVAQAPVCTASKLDAQANSRDIDHQVKTLKQEALSIYHLDAEKLKQLRPDLILTQAQCEVCAVSLTEVEEAVSQWPGERPQILSLSPNRLADIWEDIRRVAEALGLVDRGREVLRSLKNRVVDIIEKTCQLKRHPTVACIEWIEPLMAAGNWMPELIELVGGKNLAATAGQASPWMDWATLVQQDPEIIVVLPCGFGLARTRAETAVLVCRPEWSRLQAVKHRQIYLADGNHYFNRPGPRIVESLEILAEIIHPECFNFGHRAKAWEKL